MSKTGRYFYTDLATGRKFCIEPIGDPHVKWGDLDPASKKITGDYGDIGGSIDEKDSIIKEENGFKNITYLKPGDSPMAYIEELLKQPTNK